MLLPPVRNPSGTILTRSPGWTCERPGPSVTGGTWLRFPLTNPLTAAHGKLASSTLTWDHSQAVLPQIFSASPGMTPG